MTNEDLARQIQMLTETMNAKFEQIDTQLSAIRTDHKNLTDIVKDMELRFEKRFETLEAGQAAIRADIAGLRHDLFIEEGSRETADETILSDQDEKYKSLDKRLRLVEAKFPDLARGSAA